jgi:hypothetical protein
MIPFVNIMNFYVSILKNHFQFIYSHMAMQTLNLANVIVTY